MDVEKGDIWEKWEHGFMIGIPVNGYVKLNGEAVMGRGLALQAARYFPDFPKKLGRAIIENGNYVHKMYDDIVTVPVKPTMGFCKKDKSNVVPHMRHKFSYLDHVPGWAMMADTMIIEWSLSQLRDMHDYGLFDEIYLPKLGCGAGGLEWKSVEVYFDAYKRGIATDEIWLKVIDRV